MSHSLKLNCSTVEDLEVFLNLKTIETRQIKLLDLGNTSFEKLEQFMGLQSKNEAKIIDENINISNLTVNDTSVVELERFLGLAPQISAQNSIEEQKKVNTSKRTIPTTNKSILDQKIILMQVNCKLKLKLNLFDIKCMVCGVKYVYIQL